MSRIGQAIAMTRRAARRTLRFSEALLFELATTLRVAATIAVVEVLVRAVPLRRLSNALGCRVDLSPPRKPGTAPIQPSELSRRTRRQLRCTYRVADVWPFSHGPCLRRALVGGHLVRDLNPSIRIGVTDGTGDLSAHAWLEIDGRPLEDVDDYLLFEQGP